MSSIQSRSSCNYSLGPHIVKRGEPFSPLRFVALFETQDPANHVIDVDEYQKLHLSHMEYTGASSRNYFKVSHVIEVTAVAFYGAWKSPTTNGNAERCSYNVEVILYEGLSHKTRIKVGYAMVAGVSIQGRELWVEFRKPVYLKQDTWYTVEFWLTGPDTMRIEEPITNVDVEVENFGPVNFDFLVGSRQMPKMEFWLVPELDSELVKNQWEIVELEKDSMKTDPKNITTCDIFLDWVSSFFI